MCVKFHEAVIILEVTGGHFVQFQKFVSLKEMASNIKMATLADRSLSRGDGDASHLVSSPFIRVLFLYLQIMWSPVRVMDEILSAVVFIVSKHHVIVYR